MTIKGRIRILQAVIAMAVVAVAAIAVVDLQASIYYLDRSQLARRQLAAASQLAVDANRYSEQIAELLLVGEPERPDFVSARSEVSEALGNLRRITMQENAFVREAERPEEMVELERIDRMATLFREIDRAVERLLALDQGGRRDEAVSLFRSEIENRLDAEFAGLIAEGLEDEREEVERIDADLVQLAKTMTITTLAVSAGLVLLVLLSGVVFSRSITRPITALTKGAQAIQHGDLDHRIPYHGEDEHALLSQRFNAMAEQLAVQRAIILDAQNALERQVSERTEQLGDANRQLIATDQQRVQLLTDISHELRTPLTALRGEAEIALRGTSKPEAAYRETLSKVIARADDLTRLVEDLLFLARSESDEIRFDHQRLDLAAVVSQAVREAAVLGREREIRMELAAAEGEAPVRGDPRRLQQLILILLDNAVKYADQRTVIQVCVRRAATSAEVSIRDHGAGIAEGDLPHVFDRFYRGGAAREQWSGGTGLGLPIARWIAQKHGGSIELSSAQGEGTEVLVRFPLSA